MVLYEHIIKQRDLTQLGRSGKVHCKVNHGAEMGMKNCYYLSERHGC